MGISLPIGSHLDDSQARRTAHQAEDFFSTAGRRAGDEFSRQVNHGLGKIDTTKARAQAASLERGYNKVADAVGKLRTEEEKLKAVNALSNATDAQKITAAERVEKARRAESRAVRELTNDMRELRNAGLVAVQTGDGFQIMGNSATKASMELSDLGASGGRLITVLGPAGIATAAVGAVEAISTLGSAAVELSGVLGLIPGIAVAAGAAFGTLKIATLGFGDALDDVGKSLQDFRNPKAFGEDQKKFAEDLQSLSPNAQQAAQAINAMIPAFDRLKMSTQDALFAGVGEELNRLASTYLPSIQTMMASVAGSFNSMFKGVANQLMTPETQQQIQQMLQNISQAFQNLAPALGPVTKAFAELANVSTSFLPGLATSVANAATEFSNFITKASESGQLRQWIQDGIDAVKELSSAVPPLIDSFKVFFGNGKESVDTVKDAVLLLAGTLKLLKGDIDGFKDVWPSFGDAVVKVFNDINSTINNLLIAPLNLAIDAINKITGLLPTGSANIPHIPDMRMGTTLPPDSSAPPGFTGGSGYFGSKPGIPGLVGGDGRFGVPTTSAPGNSRIPGLGLATGASAWWPTVQPVPAGGYTNPGLPPDDAKGKKQPLPTVPYGNQDPMSLLQGFPVTASLYSAAGAVLDQQQKVAQARSDLATLEKSGTATQSEVVAKKNELARAEREQHEAELRLIEAKQSATNKSLKSMQTTHDAMSTLGAGLDQDLGASKGLAGLADNLVRFVGNLATAPLQASLQRQIDADPRKGGFGLLGILGAQGAFGEQYTGLPQASGTQLAAYKGGASGGYAGGYSSDAALLSMIPKGVGQYDNVTKDLSRGLVDCASGVEDLVNLIDGKSTAGGSLWTGNAASVLPGMGFLPGMGGPGDFRIGYNSGHMQATLPGGTNVNFGSTSAIRAGGMDGGQGAYDPSFTSHWYRPAGAMASGAQDATSALNGLAGAANKATQALSGGGPGAPSTSASPSLGIPPLTNPDTSRLSLPGGPAAGFTSGAAGPGSHGGGNWWGIPGNFNPGAQIDTSNARATNKLQGWLLGEQGTPGIDYNDYLGLMQDTYGPNPSQGKQGWVNQPQPQGFVGGGPMYPGVGMPNGLPGVAPLGPIGPEAQNPTQIGAVVPEASGVGKGGIGMSQGGLMDMAMQVGGAGLDMLAPGAGQAAQTGIKLANRAIQFGGQAAGIGVQGLMDTFLPMGGSQLAQSNWATRIIGGLAGALPAIPNMAGKKAPEQAQGGQGQGGAGNTTTVNHNTTINAEGRDNGGLARDWEYNTTQAAMTPAVGP